jgi:hypothetical protein
MMTGHAISTIAFDYGTLTPSAAILLRQQAARLRGLITKTTGDMIDIGADLIRIKSELDHGQFTSWIEAEIGVSIRTAQGYMRFAMLAEGKCETVSLLPPSAVRMLAAKSAPVEVVQHVFTQAAASNIMPDRAVKDMIDETNHVRRQQQVIAERPANTARKPKAVRYRVARQKLEREAEMVREKAATTARAQSIIDRLAPDDLKFVMDALSWEVMDELLRLYRERVA